MEYPTYNLEKKLINRGYQNIVGLDEVGRGALAGPLVAVATRIFKSQVPISKQISKFKFQNSKLVIRDSKQLSEKIREVIFEELAKNVIWSIGLVSHKEIDRIGITKANILVMERAIDNLKIKPDYLLLDKVYGFKHRLPFQSIIDGDAQVLSIAAASILAKVTRDRLMRKFHQKYPEYNFDKHKGYGTALHRRCLKEYGICRIHRASYGPIQIIKLARNQIIN